MIKLNWRVNLLKNIKLIRVINDFTQLKVQMETGINQSTLSKYETGELMPTTENLIILAQFYHTSLDYLMDLTDETRPYPSKAKPALKAKSKPLVN